MRKHTKALATIMAAAALAMVTNSRIPITNIWYYVGQDGKWYCFDRNNGDMKRGTTIDGYTVDFILAGFRESSRRKAIISPSDLSHHRTYRSVYGGSINLTCNSLFGVVVFHGYKTKLS